MIFVGGIKTSCHDQEKDDIEPNVRLDPRKLCVLPDRGPMLAGESIYIYLAFSSFIYTKFFVGTFAKGLEHLFCKYFLLSQHENGLICLPQYDFDGWNISKAAVVTRTHQNLFSIIEELVEFWNRCWQLDRSKIETHFLYKEVFNFSILTLAFLLYR